MPAKTGETKISQYLNEAQATEQALIQNLAAHIAMTPAGSYREALEGHLEETREHSRSVGERLREVGPDPCLAGIAVRAAERGIGLAGGVAAQSHRDRRGEGRSRRRWLSQHPGIFLCRD